MLVGWIVLFFVALRSEVDYIYCFVFVREESLIQRAAFSFSMFLMSEDNRIANVSIFDSLGLSSDMSVSFFDSLRRFVFILFRFQYTT